MSTKPKYPVLFTVPSSIGDIECSLNPCILVSFSGSDTECLTTSFCVKVEGKYKETFLKDVINYRGELRGVKGRAIEAGYLFPDLQFRSKAVATKHIPTIKQAVQKVIDANKWNIVDTKA